MTAETPVPALPRSASMPMILPKLQPGHTLLVPLNCLPIDGSSSYGSISQCTQQPPVATITPRTNRTILPKLGAQNYLHAAQCKPVISNTVNPLPVLDVSTLQGNSFAVRRNNKYADRGQKGQRKSCTTKSAVSEITSKNGNVVVCDTNIPVTRKPRSAKKKKNYGKGIEVTPPSSVTHHMTRPRILRARKVIKQHDEKLMGPTTSVFSSAPQLVSSDFEKHVSETVNCTTSQWFDRAEEQSSQYKCPSSWTLGSPARLSSPPLEENTVSLTSTPSRGILIPEWLSPISHKEHFHLQESRIDSGIFSDENTATFLPQQLHPLLNCCMTSPVPADKSKGMQEISMSPLASHNANDISRSPKTGSLREFGIVGLTPIKPCGLLNMSLNLSVNQSFSDVLKEMDLECGLETGK